jgi:hypothetical protein
MIEVIPSGRSVGEVSMSDSESHPDRPGRSAGPAASTRTSGKNLSTIFGVFAGTGRGAGIGAAVGTCGCFLAMLAFAIEDSPAEVDDGMPLGARLIAWAFVAAWFLVVSLVFGGVGGAILGAMAGASFPVRRGPG